MSRRLHWMNFAWSALAPPVEIFGTEAKPRGPLEVAQRRWRSQMPGSTAPGVSTSLGTMATQPGSTRSRTCVVGPKAKTIRASEPQLDLDEDVFARVGITVEQLLLAELVGGFLITRIAVLTDPRRHVTNWSRIESPHWSHPQMRPMNPTRAPTHSASAYVGDHLRPKLQRHADASGYRRTHQHVQDGPRRGVACQRHPHSNA